MVTIVRGTTRTMSLVVTSMERHILECAHCRILAPNMLASHRINAVVAKIIRTLHNLMVVFKNLGVNLPRAMDATFF